MLRLRFTKLTEHRSCNDDAHAQNNGSSDNGRSHISVLQNFAGEMAGSALVENLETDNCRKNADGGKNQHVADSLQQGLRMPRGRLGCIRRERGGGDCEHDKGGRGRSEVVSYLMRSA